MTKKYTLKSYYNSKLIERFENRSVPHLRAILCRPSNHQSGITPFGDQIDRPNKFDIYNAHMEKLFSGTVDDAMSFLNSL